MCLLQLPGYPKRKKREPLPYWVDVHADLSLCWLHNSCCRFCHALTQMVIFLYNLCFFCLNTKLLGSTFKPSYIQNHFIMNNLVVSKQNWIDYIEKMTLNGHFFYIIYPFFFLDTKMNRLYRQMTINGHFFYYNLYIFLRNNTFWVHLQTILYPKFSYKEPSYEEDPG